MASDKTNAGEARSRVILIATRTHYEMIQSGRGHCQGGADLAAPAASLPMHTNVVATIASRRATKPQSKSKAKRK